MIRVAMMTRVWSHSNVKMTILMVWRRSVTQTQLPILHKWSCLQMLWMSFEEVDGGCATCRYVKMEQADDLRIALLLQFPVNVHLPRCLDELPGVISVFSPDLICSALCPAPKPPASPPADQQHLWTSEEPRCPQDSDRYAAVSAVALEIVLLSTAQKSVCSR